jgi:DNA-binding SARP family transcriptional activator
MIAVMGNRSTPDSSADSVSGELAQQADTMPASGEANARVHVRLVGPPHLLIGGHAHVLERKDAALLTLLAMEGGAQRERAAALIWPDADGAKARSNLRQRLHRLRRLCACDVIAGVSELRLVEAISHDLQAPRVQFERDAEVLDGDLLATLDYADCSALAEWVDAARERWRRLRRGLLSDLAAELQRQDRVAAALACAERLVRDEPSFEAAYRMLMRLHLRRGDRAAALAAYERCREALAHGLGAEPDVETRTLHRHVLRGDVEVSSTARPQSVAVLRPPRLVGRETEWALLAQAWTEHKVVLLAGEPGVGKSRLLADFATAFPGRIVVGGRPGDTHAAYALLARLLRELVTRVDGPLPAWVEAQLALLLPERAMAPAKSWSPVRLRQALLAVIARTEGDVQGVLVDDAQFSDAATLQLLTTVCLEEGKGTPNWLIAARADDMPDVLSSWVAASDPHRLHTLRLGPLDEDGVKALLHSLALPMLDVETLTPMLMRQTGGNPMFLLESMRAQLAATGSVDASAEATWSTPSHVGELIHRRLARLPAAALDLAHVAALAGQDFDAALAASALQRHPLDLADPWRQLEAAQIIRAAAFSHDLIREATLRSVPAARAVELHAHIAAWLEQHEGEPARLAVHWKAAGCMAHAGRAFAAAAERLRSRVRRDEEARLLQEADACFEAAGENEAQSETLLHLFRSHWDRKDRAGIRVVAAKMQEVARSPKARVHAAFARAMLATDERPDPDSLALVQQAREAAERHARDTGDEGPLAQVLVWEASTEAILNRTDAALQTGRRVAELLPRLPNDRWRGHVHYNLGFTFEVCGDLREALAQFERCEAIMVEQDLPVHVADTRSMASISLFQIGRLQEATSQLESGRRMWAEMNGGRAEPHTSDIYIARYWREAGRFGEALAVLQDSVERAARVADVNLQGWAAGELAGLFVLLGQPARAASLLPLTQASPKPHVRFDGLLAQARSARALGESPHAALEAALALLPLCMRAQRLGWLLDIERARTMPAEQAAALMRANVESAVARQAWFAAAPSQAMWIDALIRAGDAPGAAQQAGALVAQLQPGGTTPARPAMTLSAAEYWLILHRAFAAAGERVAASEALAAGVAWVLNVALPNVPDQFRESFMHRNAVNRELLAGCALTPQ